MDFLTYNYKDGMFFIEPMSLEEGISHLNKGIDLDKIIYHPTISREDKFVTIKGTVALSVPLLKSDIESMNSSEFKKMVYASNDCPSDRDYALKNKVRTVTITLPSPYIIYGVEVNSSLILDGLDFTSLKLDNIEFND